MYLRMSGRFAEDQIWALKCPCYIMLTGLLKNYKLSLMWCILLMRCNICSIVLKNFFFFPSYKSVKHHL